jgi:hypothetical protein
LDHPDDGTAFIASEFDVASLYGSDDAPAALDAANRLVRHDRHAGGEIVA